MALSLTKMRATDTTGRLSLAPRELQLLIGSFLSVVMMPKEPMKVNLFAPVAGIFADDSAVIFACVNLA